MNYIKFAPVFLLCLTKIQASESTWTAETTNSDLNVSANWTPSVVPGSGDIATFNNALPNIDLNPIATANFNIGTLNFVNSASLFTLTFTDCSLLFDGSTVGIFSTSNNPIINITNSSATLSTQFLLNGSSLNTLGSPTVTISNTSTDQTFEITSQFDSSSAPITVSSYASLTATNIATATDLSGSSSHVGLLNQNQMTFNTFSGDDSISVSATNNGTISGATSDSLQVGYVSNDQFNASSAFNIGDRFNLTISNLGSADSSGSSSYAGYIAGNQASFTSSLLLGNYSNILITNSGNTISGSSQYVGSINHSQLYIFELLTAGDYLDITLNNSGTDSSALPSSSNNTASLVSQGVFSDFFSGNYTSIFASNIGTSTGAIGGANLGTCSSDQVVFGATFTTNDHLTIQVANEGNSTAVLNSNSIGKIGTNMLHFQNTFVAGDYAAFTLTNKGTQGQTNSSTSTGVVQSSQLQCDANFYTRNHFNLTVSNTGATSDTANGTEVGEIIAGSQCSFSNFYSGDHATISVSNLGTNTGSSLSGCSIGTVGTNDQLTFSGDFTSGDFSTIDISNNGNSTGSQTNTGIGYINNDMLYIGGVFTTGNNATIRLSNSGTNTSGGDSNNLGSIQRFQLQADANFYTGDYFELTVSNTGVNTGSGASNYVGSIINGYQAYFASNVTLGNNPTITVTNSGNYTGTDANTYVGFTQDQFLVSGKFISGENLTLLVTNDAINPNSAPNIGTTINQIYFNDITILKDRTKITASNSGVVGGNQIYFGNSLITTGTVTLKALNTGTSTSGIHIPNSFGGDIRIQLQNSSLTVDNSTLLLPFTLGALDGDSLSNVTCAQGLIIDTPLDVAANFAGTVNSMPAIIKKGLGTQTLSGTVDPTSTSDVNEGILNITGTFDGAILINSGGTLKGSGSISDLVTNSGTISPTQTFTLASFINQSNGVFDAFVGTSSTSYLALITGPATLNGGSVFVQPIDQTYTFHSPYTILTSNSGVSGTFSSASALTPMITPILTYDAHHVFLTLSQNIGVAANSSNQMNVANELDLLTSPTLLQSSLISQIVDLSLADAGKALTSLSGWEYADIPFFLEGINRQFIRRLYDPIRSIVTCNPCINESSSCCNDFMTWYEVGGNFSYINNRANLYGYQFTGGIQKRFCSEGLIGFALSYEGDYVTFEKNGGTEYINNALLGLYTLYRPKYFYLLADLAYDFSPNSVNRTIQIGTTNYKAESHSYISELTFYSEIGADISIKNFLIQPFFGLEVGSFWRNHINETSSSAWQLIINNFNHTDVYTRLGLHLTGCKIPYNFLISIDLAWDYRVTSQNNAITAQFESFGNSFEITGATINKNSLDYSVTIENKINKSWDVYLETSGQIFNRASTFALVAGFGFSW